MYAESADHRDAGDVGFRPFDVLHEERKLSCIERSIIGKFRSFRIAAAIKICQRQQLGGVWRTETNTCVNIPYKRTRYPCDASAGATSFQINEGMDKPWMKTI
jgi:hypothetical protein